MKPFFIADDCDFGGANDQDGKSAWRPSISLEKANRLLKERGLWIECVQRDGGGWYASTDGCLEKTHRALLVNIQRIEKVDSLDDILKEGLGLCELQVKEFLEGKWQAWKIRAEKFLEDRRQW